jgi:hypothetical protein
MDCLMMGQTAVFWFHWKCHHLTINKVTKSHIAPMTQFISKMAIMQSEVGNEPIMSADYQIGKCREVLLKGKTEYSSPPCTE